MSTIMTEAQAPDVANAQEFAFQIVGDTTATLMGTLSVIGDRLGLFETLAQHGLITTADFAAQAQIHPRYAREWLAAMACHGGGVGDHRSRRRRLEPGNLIVRFFANLPAQVSSRHKRGIGSFGAGDPPGPPTKRIDRREVLTSDRRLPRLRHPNRRRGRRYRRRR